MPPSPELAAQALEALDREQIEELLIEVAHRQYEERELRMGAETLRLLERIVMLTTIDRLWVEHLTAMDDMREGIGLHAYGQVDPLVAYKREAFDMFDQLMANIRNNVTRNIYHVELQPQTIAIPTGPNPTQLQENYEADGEGGGGNGNSNGNTGARRPVRQAAAVGGGGGGVALMQKVGRNDPCPCGSGRKFKKCHGGVG